MENTGLQQKASGSNPSSSSSQVRVLVPPCASLPTPPSPQQRGQEDLSPWCCGDEMRPRTECSLQAGHILRARLWGCEVVVLQDQGRDSEQGWVGDMEAPLSVSGSPQGRSRQEVEGCPQVSPREKGGVRQRQGVPPATCLQVTLETARSSLSRPVLSLQNEVL